MRYLGKSPLQDLGWLFDHSSHQKPHFEQPLTIRPSATMLATNVSRLITRASSIPPRIVQNAKTVDEAFRRVRPSRNGVATDILRQ